MLRRRSAGDYAFDIFNYIILGLWGLLAILPFIYVVSSSFATESQLSSGEIFLFPKEVSLDAYRYIFSTDSLLRGLGNSVFITVLGTVINLFFTTTMAYALSRKELYGRNVFLNLVIFTMLFSGGMVPTYLVVKTLHLLDTYWALILPTAINTFNLIVVKNFFQDLPGELMESAKIDGCEEIGVFWRIALPLSMPVLATFSLFYAVGHWNAFFPSLLYLSDNKKWPLQVILRQLVLLSQGSMGDMAQMDANFTEPPKETVKMAVIVMGTVPILCVYPFLQKHFAKGVMVGAIKG